jgi:hypothetical protein
MDHLSHPLRRQRPATHHQPDFHRRTRSSALRTQRRLPRRKRRRPPHPASPNLRRHLCSVVRRRVVLARPAGRAYLPAAAPKKSGAGLPTAVCKRKDGAGPLVPDPTDTIGLQPSGPEHLQHRGRAALQRRVSPSMTGALAPARFVSGHSLSDAATAPISTASTGAVSPAVNYAKKQAGLPSCFPEHLQHRGRAALQRRVSPSMTGALAPARFVSGHSFSHAATAPISTAPTGAVPRWPLTTGHCSCGKQIHHSRTKPVIAADTTCCVSLLTGTISGSNFAIPEHPLKPVSRERDGLQENWAVKPKPWEGRRPEVTALLP